MSGESAYLAVLLFSFHSVFHFLLAMLVNVCLFPRHENHIDTIQVVKVVSGFSFMGSKDFFENNIRVSIDADPLGSCLPVFHLSYCVQVAWAT